MSFETIYVALLEEGTDCWRPVLAEPIDSETYRIKGEIPEEEVWEFQPGDVVRCRAKTFSDGSSGLVPYAKVNDRA